MIKIRLYSFSETSPRKKKMLCAHDCEEYVVIDTDDETIRLCRQDAIDFAENLLEALNVPKAIRTISWTPEETKSIKAYIYEHLEKGEYSKLARKYNKTQQQIKDKLHYLRKKEIEKHGFQNVSEDGQAHRQSRSYFQGAAH